MASLQELLAEEGFQRSRFSGNRNPTKPKTRIGKDESIRLPVYICRDRKSFGFSNRSVSPSGSSDFSSKLDSDSYSSISKPSNSEAAIDEVAVKAVVSILSGYIGRYLRDERFRQSIREKSNYCMTRKRTDMDKGILANMELGIQSIEKLVESKGTRKEVRMKSLRNSIQLLSIVSSLNCQDSKNNVTCRTPNSHLSACAQLYLSIVYKLEKNDRISARHLLQVFRDSPFIARTHLLPDLWEHFFLPHLLHLKIWYTKETEFLLDIGVEEKEKRIAALNKVYNDQLDLGTARFALYYKEWLKVGVKEPPIPSVPLPSRPNYGGITRRKSSDSRLSNSSINRNLYQAVFGPNLRRQSVDLDSRNRAMVNSWHFQEQQETLADEDNNSGGYVQGRMGSYQRSLSQNYRTTREKLWIEKQKADYYRIFSCRRESTNFSVVETTHLPSSDLHRAVTTICSSNCLNDCELAIRVVTKSWLDSQGDLVIEKALSKTSFIEGMLEILSVSNNDEILELAISILAELTSRNDTSRQVILNYDPQLEIFIRLLRSSSLFLKAAVLLYLVKPKAKQMISIDWIPLFLRVLEFGDQSQTLFTVQYVPSDAVFYFLDQLVNGFNEDKNLENAREIVSLGGLSLLVKRMEKGEIGERKNVVSIINICIPADGSCRHYLASNLNKASLIELLVQEKQGNSAWCVVVLLTELLCLDRRTQIINFLDGLKNGGGSTNTMHVLLAYLHRAPPEECPLIAATLLHLDLLGDHLKCSVYREEAVDAIIAALDCEVQNEKVQEQSARALLLLGGRFSNNGEASTESWLLKQAGFDENFEDSIHFKGKESDGVEDKSICMNEEDEASNNWQTKMAVVLLKSGSKKLLEALSKSIATGIPHLARVSIVMIAWISIFVSSIGDENFRAMACSTLVPQLLKCLNYDRALEERVLASFALLRLIKCSECAFMLSHLGKELMGPLRNLALVTWTAHELMLVLQSNFKG